MRQDAVMVFDDTMGDTTDTGGTYFSTQHTSLEYTDLLSSAAQITLQVVADRLAGSTDTPLSVALEHSANGYDWKPKNDTPELSGAMGGHEKLASLAGGERWPARPSLRFVRLRIDAGDRKTPFAVQLKVYVTARVRGSRSLPLHPDVDVLLERLPRAELLFGVRGEVLNELQQLLLGTSHLAGEARSGEVIRGMRERSKHEVSGMVRRIQRMDVDSKRLLLGLSRGLTELLSADLREHDAAMHSRPVAADAVDTDASAMTGVTREGDPGERRSDDAG